VPSQQRNRAAFGEALRRRAARPIRRKGGDLYDRFNSRRPNV